MSLTQMKKLKIVGSIFMILGPVMGLFGGYLFYLRMCYEEGLVEYAAFRFGGLIILLLAVIFLIVGLVMLIKRNGYPDKVIEPSKKRAFKTIGITFTILAPFLGLISGYLFYLSNYVEEFEYKALLISGLGILILSIIFLILGVASIIKSSKK